MIDRPLSCATCGRLTHFHPNALGLCARCAKLAEYRAAHTAGRHTEPNPRCIQCRGFRPGDEIETGRMGRDTMITVALVLEVGGSILKLRGPNGECFAHAHLCRLITRARTRPRRGLQ